VVIRPEMGKGFLQGSRTEIGCHMAKGGVGHEKTSHTVQ
jgi:hypothetical protein